MLEILSDTLLQKKKIPGQKGGRDPLGPLLNPPLIFYCFRGFIPRNDGFDKLTEV